MQQGETYTRVATVYAYSRHLNSPTGCSEREETGTDQMQGSDSALNVVLDRGRTAPRDMDQEPSSVFEVICMSSVSLVSN